jgi:ribonuclease P protein component
MAGLGLPKSRRITEANRIREILALQRKKQSTHFSIYIAPNDGRYARLAVIVGRKTAKLAVQRNCIRRAVREAFRLHQNKLEPLDIVVRVTASFDRKAFSLIESELLAGLL